MAPPPLPVPPATPNAPRPQPPPLHPTNRAPAPLPVLKGTLDVLVLKALTWQPMHGFEITSWLESRSGHRLTLEDAALYQALYRLEKRGLVSAAWGLTEGNRRA